MFGHKIESSDFAGADARTDNPSPHVMNEVLNNSGNLRFPNERQNAGLLGLPELIIEDGQPGGHGTRPDDVHQREEIRRPGGTGGRPHPHDLKLDEGETGSHLFKSEDIDSPQTDSWRGPYMHSPDRYVQERTYYDPRYGRGNSSPRQPDRIEEQAKQKMREIMEQFRD